MLTIKFIPNEDPKEIFKKLVQVEAEYENAKNYTKPALPKFVPNPKPKKGIAGWYNFIATTLKELKP